MGDSDYSFSLTTFSPQGKLGQLENALARVADGKPALGIKAVNGVVLATEKKAPTLLVDESSFKKIEVVSENVGMVYAGMPADYRVLLQRGRNIAEQYKSTYREIIPMSQMVREEAAVMQEFTQSGGVRPFGISLMMAGYDDSGPLLYQVDPAGTYFGWKASAIGKNAANMKNFLEKRYSKEMELDDAVSTAILTLKEGFEGAITKDNIEIGIIGADKKFKVLTPAEVQDYLDESE
jgi:20S proteasome subunit alpha 2